MTDPSSLIMFTSSMPGMLLTANNQIIILEVLVWYIISWQDGDKCMNLIEASGIIRPFTTPRNKLLFFYATVI